jgi:predicted nucleic acid-binding protein
MSWHNPHVQVLVSDTSVLIDIQRASLLPRIFDLPYEFIVPDVLYETELLDWMGPELVEMGLGVAELDANETRRATLLKREQARLSTPDVFAFCLAAERGWTLLTGDGALRKEAHRQKLDMHGVLWLFDELENHEVCGIDLLCEGLETLRNHPRCRLPTKEVNIRLARYQP